MDDKDYMLTTYDNPFSPFDEFEAWWKYDMRMKHNTCGVLAIAAATSPVFSDEVNDQLTVEAMDQLCADEPLLYRKVTKADYTKPREVVAMG